jgi:hypothetical protein
MLKRLKPPVPLGGFFPAIVLQTPEKNTDYKDGIKD